LGHYIADFYCVAVKLVIELDGDSHSERAEADACAMMFCAAKVTSCCAFITRRLSMI
jgi:very-short-patch-repair endonuclease